jgi:ABC-2 type transport system ATP-binding protein
MKEITVDIEGLTKSFGDRIVVKDLTLKVPKGEIYGFLGPNGSGKTTTIRMLCGLITPDSGRGSFLGYDILTQSDEIKRDVGYMTQRFSLYSDLSIRENLEFVARVYGVPNPSGAATEAIHRLGLEGSADQLAGELSGGWKQRLALGACILPSPLAARRAQGRRRSQGAARVLGGDPPPRGGRHHRAGLDPLHGRGGALSRDRLYRLRRAARAGDAHEVVARSGLSTWIVSGRDLQPLAEALHKRAGVDMVAPFGAELHVSGRDRRALDKAIAAAKKADGAHRWKRGEPSLEDECILLMNQAKDNYS